MIRRNFLVGVGLSSIVTALNMRVHAASQTGSEVAAEEMVDLLYVQSAQGAALDKGLLTLKNVNQATIFFSDRPERIVGHEPTEDFIADWEVGEDNFASNPPNATLSILSGGEPQEIVLVLKNPRLAKDDLIYDIEVLDGNQQAHGGASSLFIDTIGRPLSPVSVAGVHRRHRRAVRSPGPI